MRSKLTLFLALFSLNIFALVDADENNHYTKAKYLYGKVCNSYNASKKCETKDTFEQEACTEREIKICKAKIRSLEISGDLSINKDVASKISSLDSLNKYNQARFNSKLVKKCMDRLDRFRCFTSLAENNIAEELFDFCDFDMVCISRLSDLEKVPPHVGQSNFNHCKKNYKRFGVYTCVRNSVRTKGITKLLKTIGSLEEKLYQCSNKLLGNTIESDIEMIKIFTDSNFRDVSNFGSTKD